jgi:hypothetical protein
VTSYPDNSHVSREQPKPDLKAVPDPVQPVVSGRVVRQKPSWQKRILKLVLGVERDNIKDYIVNEVVRPGIRDVAFEAVTSGLQKRMYGTGQPGKQIMARVVSTVQQHQTNYGNYSKVVTPQTVAPRRTRTSEEFANLVYSTRPDAVRVLTRLQEAIRNFQSVSVRVLYELSGEDSFLPTDEKWGWHNLDRVEIVRVPGGYVIDLPSTETLD